ncbi:uncharacterized protein isoform X2 [Rhodnius prolixus]|uniref:uncharacterized protein isoform X2 n=1 Tax=Rhodnius prolixus TaxID=13249 RepID=UPI003D18E24E
MLSSREIKDECGDEQSSSKRVKLTEDSKTALLASILEREIIKEISVRRGDLETIEQRIYQTRQSLAKIRQGVVSEYYKQNYKGVLQLQPHPAVKDTFIGKFPSTRTKVLNNEEHEQDDVEAYRTELETIDTNSSDNTKGCESKENFKCNQISKMPRYIPPKYRDKDIVRSCEPRGNVKKKKYRISIGNVSKWIGNALSENTDAKYKWTVYVRCTDQEEEITSLISKVTFFLHSSYKPNDVVTVDYAPFKLTRRGWGEFPLRVQLHFINTLDKPVDVIHLLKLDPIHSGLETFGCETIVDVWAHGIDNNEYNNESSMNGSDVIESLPTTELQPVLQQPPTTLPEVKTTAADLSDNYLSETSLSMISMQPTEIPNEIIQEVLGEVNNHDDNVVVDNSEIVAIKEEIIDSVYNLDNPMIPTELVNSEGGGNLSVKQEISDNVAPIAVESGESDDKNWFLELENTYRNEIEQSSFHQNIVDTLEENALSIETNSIENQEILSSDYTSDQNYHSQSQELFSENTTTSDSGVDLNSSQITYNPIECLNFVQDEIIIKSEDVVEEIQPNEPSVNNLTCKYYLENFMNSEIIESDNLKPIEEEQMVVQEVIIPVNEVENIQLPVEIAESKFNEQNNIQEISINEKLIKLNDNKSCDFNLIENSTSDRLVVNNISQYLDKLKNTNQLTKLQNIKNNSECLDGKKMPFSLNNQPNFIKSEIVNKIKSNNHTAKILVQDINSVRNYIISPKKTNLTPISLSNLNINKDNNTKTLVNKQQILKTLPVEKSAVNKTNLTSFNKKNSVQQLILSNSQSTNLISKNIIKSPVNDDRFKKKLYIEMPNGQLKEIHSGTTLNDCKLTPSSKPIIIESQPINKRKFCQAIASSLPEVKRTLNEPTVKKVVLQPGYRIVPSTTRVGGGNGQILPNARLVLPVKAVQKGKQSLLKTGTSVNLLQQTSVVKSSSVAGVANGAQIVKINNTASLVLENRNLIQQRKVLPGESLLRKGISSQKAAEPSSRPEIALIPGCLSNRELLKRCPRERVEFAVNWLIKHCPLVNSKAGLEPFKRVHPYCAVDEAAFLKWPIGKQRAAEWMRAKKLKRLIGKVCPSLKPWSTLQVIDWARLRGFTPLGLSLKCNNLSIVNKDISFSFTAADVRSIVSDSIHLDEKDVEVDVDSDLEADKVRKTESSISEDRLYFPLDKKYQDIGNFIFKSCDKIGLHFYEEELTAGVVYPSTERVLISVFHSVIDDLFRRSLNASCMRSGAIPATEILLDDVKMALLSREEFDLFTNEGFGT